MTENEAIARMKYRISTATEAMGKGADGKAYEDMEMAIKALEEIQKYRAIGTVEQCLEAMGKHTAKNPQHFYKKYGKHTWRRKENGEIDDFAFEFDYHNGVSCEVCGETVCVHCNPSYDELDDCEEEYWICPNCGKHIYGETEYCSCGQHLKWSD